MNEMMNWAAHYNTLIIQVAFSVVLLLILIYIYRLFFVSSMSPTSTVEGGADLSEVNEKLNQLLKNGPIANATVPATPAASGNSQVISDELEKLKVENAQLKVQLNESEKKVFDLAPGSAADEAKKAAANAPVALIATNEAEVIALNKKIEELQSRLSEYDIIADDIAELSQLRAENAELKKRVEVSSGFEGILAAVPQEESAPVQPAEPEVISEPANVADRVIEPVTEPPTESSANLTALPDLELPDLEIQTQPSEEPPSLVEPVAEIMPETNEAEPAPAPEASIEVSPETTEVSLVTDSDVSVDQTVPEAEKSLMNEFEKSTQKG